MVSSAIIGLLIAGIVLGILGRILAPGEQKIPFWLTIWPASSAP